MREQFTRNADYIECLAAIEDGMIALATRRDCWQNKIVYALCAAVRLLLIRAIKEDRHG